MCGDVALVTPYMGVCIETRLPSPYFYGVQTSHPIWVCVLKQTLFETLKTLIVTPYMGVCIETYENGVSKKEMAVTPYMGVCIETDIRSLPSLLL